MIETVFGFVLLLAAYGFVWIVAAPLDFALWIGLAIVMAGALSLAMLATALGCRGVDKIRGGI
jgi:hypothetical protein